MAVLFVHSGYVDLRLRIGKAKLLRERSNNLERKDLSRSIDAFLGLEKRNLAGAYTRFILA